jgi:hypothetical protein
MRNDGMTPRWASLKMLTFETPGVLGKRSIHFRFNGVPLRRAQVPHGAFQIAVIKPLLNCSEVHTGLSVPRRETWPGTCDGPFPGEKEGPPSGGPSRQTENPPQAIYAAREPRLLIFQAMRTLASPGTLDKTIARIETLKPEDRVRWGRMNVSQMVCHLCDSAKVPLEKKVVPPAELGALSVVQKWAALKVPIRWHKGSTTPPEIDQLCGSTPSVNFERDRSVLIVLTCRLLDVPLQGRAHPYFGPLTRHEWMRWAWLHTDHHLRQFGC